MALENIWAAAQRASPHPPLLEIAAAAAANLPAGDAALHAQAVC